jgi:hypothetical protein
VDTCVYIYTCKYMCEVINFGTRLSLYECGVGALEKREGSWKAAGERLAGRCGQAGGKIKGRVAARLAVRWWQGGGKVEAKWLQVGGKAAVRWRQGGGGKAAIGPSAQAL